MEGRHPCCCPKGVAALDGPSRIGRQCSLQPAVTFTKVTAHPVEAEARGELEGVPRAFGLCEKRVEGKLEDAHDREFGRLRREIVEDESIAPGGCRVFTSHGHVDADLQTQLDRVTMKLLPGGGGGGGCA